MLKDITYEYVDKSLLDRPKKGFGVPLNLWLRKYLTDELNAFMDKDRIVKQGIFNYDTLQRMNKMVDKSTKSVYSTLVWSYYVFQRWYQCYIEDLWN